jgi:hypothetical protein
MHRIVAILRLAVLITACVVAVTGNAGAAGLKRLALVIANTAYVHTQTLNNPLNDATLISGKLRELGFDVQFEKDVGEENFPRCYRSSRPGWTRTPKFFSITLVMVSSFAEKTF